MKLSPAELASLDAQIAAIPPSANRAARGKDGGRDKPTSYAALKAERARLLGRADG